MSQPTPKPYPLHWPENQPRTPRHEREWGQFTGLTHSKAIGSLLDEVRRLGVKEGDFVLSTDMPVRLDGLPYANRSWSDSGAALWFKRKGKLLCIAVDKFDKPEKNIRAIAMLIEGRRREERYGTDYAVEASWEVFEHKALPQTAGDAVGSRPWRDVLGLGESASIEIAEAAYRALIRTTHPDVGGDAAKTAELNEAIRQAREELAAGVA